MTCDTCENPSEYIVQSSGPQGDRESCRDHLSITILNALADMSPGETITIERLRD